MSADLHAVTIAEISRLERIAVDELLPAVRALRFVVDQLDAHAECPEDICLPAAQLRGIAVMLGADVALEPAVPSGEASDG